MLTQMMAAAAAVEGEGGVQTRRAVFLAGLVDVAWCTSMWACSPPAKHVPSAVAAGGVTQGSCLRTSPFIAAVLFPVCRVPALLRAAAVQCGQSSWLLFVAAAVAVWAGAWLMHTCMIMDTCA